MPSLKDLKNRIGSVKSTQKISEFEQSLIQKLNAKGSNILESIKKDKSISDDTEKALKDTLDELVKNFA